MATISKVSMDIKRRIMSSWKFRDTRQAKILLENRMYKLNMDRLEDGINVLGKPLKKYSPGYARYKRDFIRGSKGQRLRRTRMTASKVYDYGRLRGRTIEKIKYQAKVVILKDRIKFVMETSVRDRESQRIIASLHNLGYDFYSGVASPRSARGQQELNELKLLLVKNMDYFSGL